jgi:hypothetical protein
MTNTNQKLKEFAQLLHLSNNDAQYCGYVKIISTRQPVKNKTQWL